MFHTRMEQDSKQTKPSFSIDSLLGKAVSANQEIDLEDNLEDNDDIDVEDDDEQEEYQGQLGTLPNLIRPIPRLLPTSSDQEEAAKEDDHEEAAIAAALQSSLFYSQHPSNYLYSQWLATRNSSALFGLQGEFSSFIILFCHISEKRY